MENLKNPGPLRRFLSRYNSHIVWLVCGVMLVAQVDLIHKAITDPNHKKGITAEEAAEEKEEVMQMIKNVSSKFDSIKSFFRKESEEPESKS